MGPSKASIALPRCSPRRSTPRRSAWPTGRPRSCRSRACSMPATPTWTRSGRRAASWSCCRGPPTCWCLRPWRRTTLRPCLGAIGTSSSRLPGTTWCRGTGMWTGRSTWAGIRWRRWMPGWRAGGRRLRRWRWTPIRRLAGGSGPCASTRDGRGIGGRGDARRAERFECAPRPWAPARWPRPW